MIGTRSTTTSQRAHPPPRKPNAPDLYTIVARKSTARARLFPIRRRVISLCQARVPITQERRRRAPGKDDRFSCPHGPETSENRRLVYPWRRPTVVLYRGRGQRLFFYWRRPYDRPMAWTAEKQAVPGLFRPARSPVKNSDNEDRRHENSSVTTYVHSGNCRDDPSRRHLRGSTGQ